ncbi:MAG: D-alanyl-D-alanine carboxypeptidase [Acidobacteria bacterium]|nr:D-alanyl-D-alanine carboxypeptidase [Acidobacteriota bacterium]
MSRRLYLWIGPLALAGLLGVAPLPVTAQTRAASAASAPAAKKPAAKPSAYSASRAKTRRARLAQARAAAAAREAAEALPRYKVDGSGALVPDLRAAAGIIYDADTNEVLWQQNGDVPRSIASITKVMTATVFLESNPDLTATILVKRSDTYRASTTLLRTGDKWTADDLLHLLLIASDNAAARALARTSPLGYDGFIARMNEKAVELGLESAHYVDPSGLLNDNVSSAFDMARLITMASQDERISSIMRLPDYTIRNGRRTVTFRSTNHLLRTGDVDVRAGKTGFITKAGYCLATVLRLPQTGQNIAVVVFGARSNTARFMESRNLFGWVAAKASSLFGAQTAAQSQG